MKIAVLISGGVDSTLALRLLKDGGHDIVAFYLKIWLEDEVSFLGSCPWEEDLSYVQAVCEQAQVPLEIISLQREYWDHVVAYTIAEVQAGHTPNPDILCNSAIKFGVFYDQMHTHFDAIASGHYAQTTRVNGITYLLTSPDTIKDQTYFLANVPRERFAKMIFPIGGFTKSQVRALAQIYNVPNKNRKDSQGICFLGKIQFSDFIRHHVGERVGDLIEWETGNKVGEHKGFWFYTRGQRQGIGLSGGPWYVVSKDATNNIVYISRHYSELDWQRSDFVVSNINLLVDQAYFEESLQQQLIDVKIRHGAQLYHARVEALPGNTYKFYIDQKDQGIAPGQYAVVYRQGICLGGGVIQ